MRLLIIYFQKGNLKKNYFIFNKISLSSTSCLINIDFNLYNSSLTSVKSFLFSTLCSRLTILVNVSVSLELFSIPLSLLVLGNILAASYEISGGFNSCLKIQSLAINIMFFSKCNSA